MYFCRLSENIIEFPGGNTSINMICNRIRQESGTTGDENGFDMTKMSSLIFKLFPKSQKSTVLCKTNRKPINSIKNIVIPMYQDNTEILFHDLRKLVPDDWFIYKTDVNKITFGYFFDIQFNGRKSFLNFTLNSKHQVSIVIDNKEIDCNLVYIPNEIEFCTRSVAALFRCMTLLRPCHGYEIKSEEENQFATASKCTKEVCITSGLPYNILRHKECLHFTLVKSKIPICKKCEIFIRSKKYKSKKSNNKENERIECSPQQIMEKILVPNLENNQLTLIESHITASYLYDP